MASRRSESRNASKWLRGWAAFVALVLGVALPVGASAQPAGAPATAPAAAPVAPVTAPLPAQQYVVPADQPHAAGKLELPLPPTSFNTVDRGWIRFSYAPSTRERVEPLMRDADSIKEELRERLGQNVLSRVHVRVARTPGEMRTLEPEGAPYPKYASGVAYSELGLVLLTLTPENGSALHDVEEIFRHELAHIALADAIGESHRVPTWFNEGLAVHLSRESPLLRLKSLSTATLAGRLIPLSRLDASFPSDATRAELAYAEAADVVRFLLRQQDAERFPALIDRVRKGESFASAVSNAYGTDLSNLEFEWREEVSRKYSFWPVFFSGGLVWVGVLVLFTLGWRRKRQKSKNTLERWAREEAFAELQRARGAPSAAPPAPRVHIVLPGREGAEPPELPVTSLGPPVDGPDVPRVQHEGHWHTLH